MNIRPTLLLCIIVAVFSQASTANTETFIREYTYVASDLDSKVTARKNAVKLIKAGVLEEIVSYTANTSLLEQSQLGETFERSFIRSATTMSAGFMRIKVLEEDWDGFRMWVKAEVRANPARVRKQLEDAIAATQHINQTYTGNGPVQKSEVPPPGSDAAHDQINAASAAQTIGATLNRNTANYGGYVKAAQLSEVLSLLMPVRLHVNQYMQMNGRWPDEMQDMHFTAKDMNDGRSIKSVMMGKQGKIFAFLEDSVGKDGLLAYTPREVMGGTQIRWDCSSNLPIKSYTGMSQQCQEDPDLRFDGKFNQ